MNLSPSGAGFAKIYYTRLSIVQPWREWAANKRKPRREIKLIGNDKVDNGEVNKDHKEETNKIRMRGHTKPRNEKTTDSKKER